MTAQVFATTDEALADVPDDASIMVGGFASAGVPTNLILALKRHGSRGHTVIANDIGLVDELDSLCEQRQIAHVIATFAIRASAEAGSRFEQQYRAGEVGLELVPQGTFAERIRAGGAGIGGFLTRTGVDTVVAEGKQVMELDGERFVLERGLRADYALVRARRADRLGNLEYHATGRNFNVVMATAADTVIAEVGEIVEPGELDPECIGTPALYVDRLVRCDPVEVRWYA